MEAPFSWAVGKSQHSVLVATSDFLAVTLAEGSEIIPIGSHLDDRLLKLPKVIQVEYNGHFGAAFHLTVEGASAPERKAERVIEGHVRRCRRALRSKRALGKLLLYQFRIAHAHGLLHPSCPDGSEASWRRYHVF